MFRTPRLLEKVDYQQIIPAAPIPLPAKGQAQNAGTLRFNVTDRDVTYDWYNAYFRVEYELQIKANGNFVAANAAPAPVNGSFSLIEFLKVQSATTKLHQANGVHKVIFIKNLLEFSDDYARRVAKDEFWYLDTTNSTVTGGVGVTNTGIQARALLSQGDPP